MEWDGTNIWLTGSNGTRGSIFSGNAPATFNTTVTFGSSGILNFSSGSVINFADGSVWKSTGLVFGTGTTLSFPDGSAWGSGGLTFGTTGTETLPDGSTWSGNGLITASGKTFDFSKSTVFINNILNAQSANYTIQPSDNGRTIYVTGGLFTITLPGVTGFASNSTVQVCNGNANSLTGRAVLLSGFPAGLFKRLWMQQCAKVSIINGNWVATVIPPRFVPNFTSTLYVDNTGNDNNDGLISNASGNALASIQECWTIFENEWDIGSLQPICSPTGGQTFTGGLSLISSSKINVFFLIGNGGIANIENTSGNVVIEEADFAGYIIFDSVNLNCTNALSHPCYGLYIHQQSGADLSTSGHTVGVTFTGASSTDIGIWCDSFCKINSGAPITLAGTFNNAFQFDFGSQIDINDGIVLDSGSTIGANVFQVSKNSSITISGQLTFNSSSVNQFIQATNNSNAILGSFTATGTITGRSFAALNNGLVCNSSSNAIPGSTGITTSSGWTSGYAVTSGGVCLP
jgi:hypothetical protein